MTHLRRLVIIGGGPAGLGAAIEASRGGLACTLIDDAPTLGGQIYRRPPNNFHVKEPTALGKDFTEGERLRAEFKEVSEQVEVLTDASVIGVWPNKRILWASDTASGILDAEQIIFATGAYERPVPFPGWTLPGVMTAGGVQTLIKTMRILPGKRALVVGSGPLILNVASRLHEIGVEVAAVLDAAEPWLETLRGGAGGSELYETILKNQEYLRTSGIRVFHNHTIFSARGGDQVEEVSFGPVEPRAWRPQRTREERIPVDLVCLGFGFIPNTELTQLAGCQHRYIHELGGWVPIRDEMMLTSVPGVFAAGDGAGIRGALVSVEEGRIAGIAAAARAGIISNGEADARMATPLARLATLAPLVKVFGEVTQMRVGLLELMQPETLVCRCEEVSLTEVTEALNHGAGDLQSIRLLTRLGMGACQGRNCSPSIGMHVCQTTGRTPEQVGRVNPRPPIKPVTFGALADMQGVVGTARSDAFDAIVQKVDYE